MNDILNIIKPTIDSFLMNHANNNLKEHNGRKVVKVEHVFTERIKNIVIELNALYSGKEIDVFPEGSIRILIDLGGSKRMTNNKFWSQGMVIKFIADKENFEVINIGSFKVF